MIKIVRMYDQNCEDVCMDDELVFLDELFKEEYNHSSEKTCAEDLKFRVPFEKNLI